MCWPYFVKQVWPEVRGCRFLGPILGPPLNKIVRKEIKEQLDMELSVALTWTENDNNPWNLHQICTHTYTHTHTICYHCMHTAGMTNIPERIGPLWWDCWLAGAGSAPANQQSCHSGTYFQSPMEATPPDPSIVNPWDMPQIPP